MTWNSALTALLRDGRLFPALEVHRRPILDVVDELRASVPGHYLAEPESAFERHLLADGSSSLLIMGDRGSGKSSLLVSVCAALLEENADVVLPIMRPDLFGESDSVISSFLASLWSVVAEGTSPGQERSEADRQLLGLLTDTARSYAASQTPAAALQHGTDSLVDFAEDTVSVSRSRTRLVGQVRRVAQSVCLPNGPEQQARVIVVPIDDPDLEPEMLGDVLRDLRVLGSIPGVVPISCLYREDLVAAWVGRHDLGRPASSERHRHHLFERALDKQFPYRLRFEVLPVSAAARPAFVPLGETRTLGEQLTLLRARLEAWSGTSWPIDEALTCDAPEIDLPSPLPANPRSLVQLWNTIDAVVTARDDAEAVMTALRRLLDLLSEPIRLALRLPVGARFYQLGAVGDGSRQSIAFRLDQVRVGVSSSTGLDDAQPPLQELDSPAPLGDIRLRPILRVTGSQAIEVDRGDRWDESPQRERLRRESLSALFAFQEIVYGGGAFDVEDATPDMIGNDEWSWLQRVQVADLSTDDHFVLLPGAKTLSEIVRSVELWNDLSQRSATGADTREMLTGAVVAATRIVHGGGLPVELPSYQDALADAFETFVRVRDASTSGAKAYKDWFELLLPQQWHSAFFSVDELRSHCARHQDAIAAFTGELDPLATDLRVTTKDIVDARLGRTLDSIHDDETQQRYCWIAGYFELAASIGSRHVERLGELHAQWRERASTIRAGGTLAGSVVTRRSGVRRFAPYPSPEGQELLRRALELLRHRVADAYAQVEQR
jgi:hypothetical protein